jgi:hypothetical protein
VQLPSSAALPAAAYPYPAPSAENGGLRSAGTRCYSGLAASAHGGGGGGSAGAAPMFVVSQRVLANWPGDNDPSVWYPATVVAALNLGYQQRVFVSYDQYSNDEIQELSAEQIVAM